MLSFITFLSSVNLDQLEKGESKGKAGSNLQKWNTTSSSSGEAHLGASGSQGKIPILWGVRINNASAWMWGTQLKGICLSQMPVTTFIPGTCRACVCRGACVWGGRENAVFTHFPSCVIYFTPWCFHLPRASEEISTHKARINTGLLSHSCNCLCFFFHLLSQLQNLIALSVCSIKCST